MSSKEIICSHIAVDCVENDKQDIRMGGPQYIGYDFYVKKEDAKEMKDFILKTLKKFGVPIESIYVAGTVVKEESKVWTKEKIHKCIANNEAGIDSNLINAGEEQSL